MTTQFTATFVDGVFVPSSPIPLEDKSSVKLTMEFAAGPSNVREAFERFLAHIEANPFHSGGDYVTREELYEGR